MTNIQISQHIQTFFIRSRRQCTATPRTTRHGNRLRRVATAYPGQRPGVCASNLKASHRHGGEVHHFNRVMANDSLVFFHIYDILHVLKSRLPLSLRVTGAALASCVADEPRSCSEHSVGMYATHQHTAQHSIAYVIVCFSRHG